MDFFNGIIYTMSGHGPAIALGEVGNTDSPRSDRGYWWFLTWNNYGSKDGIKLDTWLRKNLKNKWVIEEEVGDSGTPHLQGQIKFHSARRFSTLKKMWPEVHWERTRNIDAAVRYCQKDRDKGGQLWQNGFGVDGFWEPEKVIATEADLYPWQFELLGHLRNRCSARDRTIHWYWETLGGCGKSEMVNYLVDNHMAICCGGRKQDALYIFHERCKKRINTKIVIFDLERSKGNRISYSALESLKNCCAFSAKYESGFFRFAAVHVVVFANKEPERGELTDVKWHVVNINNC